MSQLLREQSFKNVSRVASTHCTQHSFLNRWRTLSSSTTWCRRISQFSYKNSTLCSFPQGTFWNWVVGLVWLHAFSRRSIQRKLWWESTYFPQSYRLHKNWRSCWGCPTLNFIRQKFRVCTWSKHLAVFFPLPYAKRCRQDDRGRSAISLQSPNSLKRSPQCRHLYRSVLLSILQQMGCTFRSNDVTTLPLLPRG